MIQTALTTMSSNYPPGAANDPDAPYNQQDPPEVEVSVTEKLVKEDVIYTRYRDSGDVESDWHDQRRTAEQCLADAARVLKALYEAQRPKCMFAGVNIGQLWDDCSGWEQVELEVR